MPAALAFIPAWAWRWLAIAGIGVACMAYGAFKMHEHDQEAYDKLAREFGEFKGGVRAAGEKAEQDRLAKEAEDKKRKEAADAENSAALATLAGTVAQLRRDRPRGGVLPAAAAGARDPDVACFFRPELERAYGALVIGVRGLGDEGSKAVIDLNTAKRWKQGLRER